MALAVEGQASDSRGTGNGRQGDASRAANHAADLRSARRATVDRLNVSIDAIVPKLRNRPSRSGVGPPKHHKRFCRIAEFPRVPVAHESWRVYAEDQLGLMGRHAFAG